MLVPLLALAWWLLSPLLFDKTVEEEFPLPAAADPSAYSSVVIYCAPFHVIFSIASLK